MVKKIVETTNTIHPLRKLTESVAFPENFTQMNVNDAKAVFGVEVLDCLFQLVTDQLKAKNGVFDAMFDRFEGNGGQERVRWL